MEHFTPTYLYIKTHNVTGLKYFGKTIGNPTTYSGSGLYWKDHLKIHGNDVTTEIFGYFTDRDECIKAAQQFSSLNDIVNAKGDDGTKIWANLMIENGLDGNVPGSLVSEETKQKRSKALKGRPRPPEVRQRISDSKKGIALSDEHIAKLTLKTISEEHRRKLSEMYSGRVWTEEEKGKIRGQIVVVDRSGNLIKIPVETYKNQPENDREYVHFRTEEGKRRRAISCDEHHLRPVD